MERMGWSNAPVQSLHPSLFGQKTKAGPNQQVSGHHCYFEAQHALSNSVSIAPPPSRGIKVILAPCSPSLPSPPASRRTPSSLQNASISPRKLRARPCRRAQQRAHNRAGERAVYPNDGNAPRRVQLADVRVGEHLSRAWEVSAHVARRNEGTRAARYSTSGRPAELGRGRGAEGLGSVEYTEPSELDDVGDVGWAAGFGRRPSG